MRFQEAIESSIDRFIRSGVIDTDLMLYCTIYRARGTEDTLLKLIDGVIAELSERLKEIMDSGNGGTLGKYYAQSNFRGHMAAINEDVMRVFGSAGRLMVTLENWPMPYTAGSVRQQITFCCAENGSRAGLHTICSTSLEAARLIELIPAFLCRLKPSDSVSLDVLEMREG